jgi:DNA-binding NarL/FixJ family response regulator
VHGKIARARLLIVDDHTFMRVFIKVILQERVGSEIRRGLGSRSVPF